MDLNALIAKIKVRLGGTLLDIELADEDITECINDATDLFSRRHYSGTERKLYVLNLDATSVTYTLPNYIHSVSGYYKFNEFNTPTLQRLVLTELNVMYESSNLINFAVFKDYIKTVEKVLMPQYDFDYNELTHRLTFRNRPHEGGTGGDIIYLEVYTDLSKTDLETIYDNNWFLRYATELSRLKWSTIVGKYDKKLTNNAKYNYERMYDMANENIQKLEDELNMQLSLPIDFLVD
jgi:hypothetical protein